MSGSRGRLSVWTEGLGEDWSFQPGHRERMERRIMTPEAVAALARDALRRARPDSECLFVVQGGARRLHLAIANMLLEVSDPGDMRYQNVAVAASDLESYLCERFPDTNASERPESRAVRVVESLVAVAAVAGLGVAIVFVSEYLSRNSGFMPKPAVLPIEDAVEAREMVVRHAGVYVTRIEDGEMAIELRSDGRWGYYDLRRSGPGLYILEPVDAGTYQPVIESDQPALLTDTHYIFYPEQPEKLVFLQRPFTRIGRTRDEVPSLAFPDAALAAL